MTEPKKDAHWLSNLWSRIPMRGVKQGSLGIADQAIISGANFPFMIVAARELGPAAFGLFAFFYLVLGMAEAVHEALITTPHTVISASKDGTSYREYTSSVAWVQTGFAAACAGVTIIAAVVAAIVYPSLTLLLLALAFACAGTLTQNFTRRVLYTESRVGPALVQDVVVHGLRLLLLGAVAVTTDLTGSRLFVIVGIAFFIGSFVGFWQIRSSLTIAFDRAVIGQHWKFGNWLGASEVAYMVPHYAAAAILSASLSVGTYGAYRAALQLVHAANVPLKALDSLLRPKLARDARHGPDAVASTMRPVAILGVSSLALFGVFLIIFREPLLELIYGSEYAPYAAVMFLLAIKPAVDVLKDLLTNALLAYHQTRSIFIRTVVGSLTGIGIGGLAVVAFGLPAAGAITLFGAIASVLWLIWAWKRQMDAEYQTGERELLRHERMASQ